MQGTLSIIRTFGMLLIVVVMVSACATKKESTRNKKASLYFGAGTQSLMDEKYTDALKSLLKANELDPGNSDILNNLGMAYYFKGEKDLAIKTINESLKFNRNNSDARINLASIFFQDGNLDLAEKTYKKVLRDLTYDKQARTLYNLGILELQHKRDAVAAETYFRKSIKEDDNYCPSYYQIGLIKFQRKQLSAALKNFKEATMGACYGSPAPHYYQALTLIELRRFDEARMKLDEIDTRFHKSVYAVKARSKTIELNDIENRTRSSDSHASRKVLESPDF